MKSEQLGLIQSHCCIPVENENAVSSLNALIGQVGPNTGYDFQHAGKFVEITRGAGTNLKLTMSVQQSANTPEFELVINVMFRDNTWYITQINFNHLVFNIKFLSMIAAAALGLIAGTGVSTKLGLQIPPDEIYELSRSGRMFHVQSDNESI